MNWVAPKLSDGLGNRLFQYSCAKQYAYKEGKECVFFLPRCGKADHGSFDAMFCLFPLVRIVDIEASWRELREEDNKLYIYSSLETNIQENIVIHGYRQSYKYFEDVSIQPDFVNALGKTRIDVLTNLYLENKEQLVFLHLRIGDYKFLPHHQIDIKKYYTEAIKLLPKGSTILFFSDELNLCDSIIRIIKVNGFTVRLCNVTDSVEALYCMSQCLRGSVVGNSTFSYWGSYFAHQNNSESIHIFPKSMGRGMPQQTDLFPPYGIQLESV
jgi:hypothetical protein